MKRTCEQKVCQVGCQQPRRLRRASPHGSRLAHVSEREEHPCGGGAQLGYQNLDIHGYPYKGMGVTPYGDSERKDSEAGSMQGSGVGAGVDESRESDESIHTRG